MTRTLLLGRTEPDTNYLHPGQLSPSPPLVIPSWLCVLLCTSKVWMRFWFTSGFMVPLGSSHKPASLAHKLLCAGKGGAASSHSTGLPVLLCLPWRVILGVDQHLHQLADPSLPLAMRIKLCSDLSKAVCKQTILQKSFIVPL